MSDETTLTQRRDEIEREWPDDEHLRMGLRQFDPGPWIYEMSYPDGRVVSLTEEGYRLRLALFWAAEELDAAKAALVEYGCTDDNLKNVERAAFNARNAAASLVSSGGIVENCAPPSGSRGTA